MQMFLIFRTEWHSGVDVKSSIHVVYSYNNIGNAKYTTVVYCSSYITPTVVYCGGVCIKYTTYVLNTPPVVYLSLNSPPPLVRRTHPG